MENGLAPQYEVRETGKVESVELHHEPPQRAAFITNQGSPKQ